jgi:hypothetical protein
MHEQIEYRELKRSTSCISAVLKLSSVFYTFAYSCSCVKDGGTANASNTVPMLLPAPDGRFGEQ